MNNWTEIRSRQNDRYKYWRKLHTRKGRQQWGTLLLEGEQMIEEAWRSGLTFRALLIADDQQLWLTAHRRRFPVDVSIFLLERPLFNQLMATENPQGIAAEVVQPTEASLVQWAAGTTHLLLDRIQDPGNLGTIFRTAEALDGTTVWLGQGCVDAFNAKVVRSAMGSLFRVPFAVVDLGTAIPYLQSVGTAIYVTSPHAKTHLEQISFPTNVAFLLGNEAQGVADRWINADMVTLAIPMSGQAESLNVSITTGVLLYERRRQVRVGR